MSEKIKSAEAPVLSRLDYGAVPLDPWNATDFDGEAGNYTTASINRIRHTLRDAVTDAILHGWVTSPEAAQELYEFMETSLYASHTARIEHNAHSEITPEMLDGNAEQFARAIDGTATPAELMDLLIAHPKIGSLELAKLSHPLDLRAADAMDSDVYAMIDKTPHARRCSEPPRYKSKRLDDTIPAAIVLRKQVIAEYNDEETAGIIQVVRRQSFLVRGDEEVETDPYLDRKIKNPERFDELAGKIERYLPSLDKHPYLKWLQIQATSYYAKYLLKNK